MQVYLNFWISPQSPVKLNPKKIILDDTVLIDSSSEYRKLLRELLEHLDKHHFNLFIKYQDEFYPLESKYFSDYCHGVYFPMGEPLVSWNKDQTLFLDIYDVQSCFEEILTNSFGIQLKNSYLLFRFESVLEKFNSNPKTKRIINKDPDSIKEEFGSFQLKNKIDSFKALFTATPHMLTTDLEFYRLNRNNIDSFIDTELNNVHTLECDDITFDEPTKLKISSMPIYTFHLNRCHWDDFSFLPQTITHITLDIPSMTETDLMNILRLI